MLLLISSIKLVTEVALLALAGQWVLGLLVGPHKDRNVFYQVLRQIGRPFVTLARWVTPRLVIERHLPLVAFLILGFVWVLATLAKISHCLRIGVQWCQ